MDNDIILFTKFMKAIKDQDLAQFQNLIQKKAQNVDLAKLTGFVDTVEETDNFENSMIDGFGSFDHFYDTVSPDEKKSLLWVVWDDVEKTKILTVFHVTILQILMVKGAVSFDFDLIQKIISIISYFNITICISSMRISISLLIHMCSLIGWEILDSFDKENGSFLLTYFLLNESLLYNISSSTLYHMITEVNSIPVYTMSFAMSNCIFNGRYNCMTILYEYFCYDKERIYFFVNDNFILSLKEKWEQQSVNFIITSLMEMSCRIPYIFEAICTLCYGPNFEFISTYFRKLISSHLSFGSDVIECRSKLKSFRKQQIISVTSAIWIMCDYEFVFYNQWLPQEIMEDVLHLIKII